MALSGTSSFVKWHNAVHELFVYNGDYICVNEWVQPAEVLPLLEFICITWKPKKTTLIFVVFVFTRAAKQKPSLAM